MNSNPFALPTAAMTDSSLSRRAALRSLAAGGLAAGLVGPATVRETHAAPATQVVPDLSGVWSGQTGDIYYVQQVDTTVWWLGMSDESGAAWTHVFHGTIVPGDNVLVGEWVDVPRGSNRRSGTLSVDIISNTALQRRAESGGFGPQV